MDKVEDDEIELPDGVQIMIDMGVITSKQAVEIVTKTQKLGKIILGDMVEQKEGENFPRCGKCGEFMVYKNTKTEELFCNCKKKYQARK